MSRARRRPPNYPPPRLPAFEAFPPGWTATDPEGNQVTIHDSVLRAVRRAD